MTLHWWQHWFWITGRAPVVGALLCLLLVGCDVRGQQQLSWGAPPGALPLPVPVALSLWPDAGGGDGGTPRRAARRLLGFAEPTVAEEDAVGASRGPGDTSTPSPSEAPPAVVTYLTTRDPSPGPGPGLNAREPKAIGAPPPSASRPSTSVLEIFDDLTASVSSPAPSASSASSTAETGAEDEAVGLPDAASSAEMPNDEPARGSDASSTTTEAPSEDVSRATPTPSGAPPGPSTTARQPVPAMSLTTAPAGPSQASVADSSRTGTVGGLSLVPASTTTTSFPSSSSSPSSSTTVVLPSSGSAPVVVHPGVSTISRSPTPPPTVTTVASAAQTSTVEPPNVLRSAPATLSVSSASSDRRSRPGGGGGPGAMSLSSGGGLDAGSITGIVLGIVVFVGLVGTVSFVLYRRRYINKPQTLNDKCSNPDSSGYIDDSTLRENSEEMYSLDNDSFLNSLEAMTIQNYWTDTVKHTKL